MAVFKALDGDFPNPYMLDVNGPGYRYIRANLVTLPSGPSPSVSVLIAELG